MRYTVSIFKKHLLMYTLMTVVCLSGCVQEEFATPPKKTENRYGGTFRKIHRTFVHRTNNNRITVKRTWLKLKSKIQK